MTKEWVPVPGLEHLVEVTRSGVLRSRRTGRILQPATTRKGYRRITIGGSNFMVHRLICRAFIGPIRSKKSQVNHKNGIKTDNRIENLEYVTGQQNMRHSFRELGRYAVRGERSGMAKLTAEQVVEIRALFRAGLSYAALAEQFNLHTGGVPAIVTGRTWAHVPGACNNIDRSSRVRRGEASPFARLNEAAVKEIRELYAPGEHTMTELAKQFGVSSSHISNIVNNKKWKVLAGSTAL